MGEAPVPPPGITSARRRRSAHVCGCSLAETLHNWTCAATDSESASPLLVGSWLRRNALVLVRDQSPSPTLQKPPVKAT